MSYYTTVMTSAIVNIIAILSMYTLMGLTGIFSMGQAAFMCVGAYTTGMLAIHSGLPMVVIVITAVIPIIIPSIVRRDLILFPERFCHASLIFSSNTLPLLSPPK